MSKTEIDSDIFQPEIVRGALESERLLDQRAVWEKFYVQPDRFDNESDDDYELRCEVDRTFAQIKASVMAGENMRAAAGKMLRKVMEDGTYVASTFMKHYDGREGPLHHLKAIQHFLGIEDKWSRTKLHYLNMYLTAILPELRRWGFKISEESYSAIILDSGQAYVPQAIREAAIAVNKARIEDGGVTKALINLIALSLDGDSNARQALLKYIRPPKEEGEEDDEEGDEDDTPRIELRSEETELGTTLYIPKEHVELVTRYLERIADIKPY